MSNDWNRWKRNSKAPRFALGSLELQNHLKPIQDEFNAKLRADRAAAEAYFAEHMSGFLEKIEAAIFDPNQWECFYNNYSGEIKLNVPPYGKLELVTTRSLSDRLEQEVKTRIPWISRVGWSTANGDTSITLRFEAPVKSLPPDLAVQIKEVLAERQKKERAEEEAKKATKKLAQKQEQERMVAKKAEEEAAIRAKLDGWFADLIDLAQIPENWSCSGTELDAQPCYSYGVPIYANKDVNLRREFKNKVEAYFKAFPEYNVTYDEHACNVFYVRVTALI